MTAYDDYQVSLLTLLSADPEDIRQVALATGITTEEAAEQLADGFRALAEALTSHL